LFVVQLKGIIFVFQNENLLMKRLFLLFILSFLIFPLQAQIKLTSQAQISILTCSPSEEKVFTVYGHTAVRVYDPANDLDYVFNYGIFDFNKPNFIYRFTKGETDYKLEATYFLNFLADYQRRGSRVVEQVLDLTHKEKEEIWNALLTNARPENAVYRYNFFFDNCATRPVALIERYLDGEVVYNHETKPQTFRQLINYSMRNKPWLIFGTELALGSPTDRTATPHEELFLPLYVEAAFDKATIKSADGSERNLVSHKKVLAEEVPQTVESTFFTPLVLSLLFLVLVSCFTFYEWKCKKYCRGLDVFLFFIAGIAGIILFFLAFISEHPATYPNWLLIWLHPLHLIGAVFIAVKKFNKAAYWYHFINFAVLTLMMLGWHFIPQHFNAAFFPLIASMWLRSGFSVYRYKSGIA